MKDCLQECKVMSLGNSEKFADLFSLLSEYKSPLTQILITC